MIKIKRTLCPDCLDTSRNNLTAQSYSRVEVLDSLLSMQNNKCCFCEKDLRSLGKSALWVEHFIAKDADRFKDKNSNTDWNQANCWNNLLYSCSTCNRNKGTINSFNPKTGKRELIDPSYSRIDPESHLDFVIDDVLIYYTAIKNSKLGKNTIKNLKLKVRSDIYSSLRKIKIEIDALFGDMVTALFDRNPLEVDSKLNDLYKRTSAHKPHASFCRKYIKSKVIVFNTKHLTQLNKLYSSSIAPINVNIASGYQTII